MDAPHHNGQSAGTADTELRLGDRLGDSQEFTQSAKLCELRLARDWAGWRSSHATTPASRYCVRINAPVHWYREPSFAELRRLRNPTAQLRQLRRQPGFGKTCRNP